MSDQQTTSDRTDQQTTALTEKDHVDPRNCYDTESQRRYMQDREERDPEYRVCAIDNDFGGNVEIAAMRDENENIAIGTRETDMHRLVDGRRLPSLYRIQNSGEIEITGVEQRDDPDDPMRDVQDWFENDPDMLQKHVLSRLFDAESFDPDWHVKEMGSTYVSFYDGDMFGHFTVRFELK